MVIERSVTARNTFEAVVKIENDFVEWQLISEHDARGREIFKIFLRATFVLAKLQDAANRIFVGDDHGLDDGLFDFCNVAGIGKFGGAVDLHDLAVDAGDAITHAWRGGDEIQAKFALEALLHDFHVQEAEETTAETKSKSDGIFRLVEKRRIVQLQFTESVAQRFVLVGEDGEHPGKNHGLDGFESWQCESGACSVSYRVAHAGFGYTLDVGDDEAYVAGFQFL